MSAKKLASHDASLREHLLSLLTGSNAHADFESAIKGLPAELRGKTPQGAGHSPWQLLEHLRIAQWDILEFSRDPSHKSPEWPTGYWPATPAPPDGKAWDKSVRGFRSHLGPQDRPVREDSPRRRTDDSARSPAHCRPQRLPYRPADSGPQTAGRLEVTRGTEGRRD